MSTHPERNRGADSSRDTTEQRAGGRTPTQPAAVVRGGAAADSSDHGEDLVGQVLAGRYQVERLLGSGGMGSVYRAEHVHMKKNVAIKVLHREMTYLPEVVARFEREAVAAARIEHPNVAAATDFGRLDDGSFYLVLEYVEGRSLSRLIKEKKRLPSELALHITRQIAEALACAHRAGIVHRDLKPDNVMLVDKDGNPYFVKVLDFGIAKLQTGDSKDQLTQLGSVFGTPEYMAPEQAAGTPVDGRADIYTLGILLYEMLSGVTPFADDDLVVVLTRQMTMDPAPLPSTVEPGVSEIAMRMLHKDPDARFQTADDVVVAISALLDRSMSPAPASVGMPMSRAEVETSDTVLSLPNPSLGMSPTRVSGSAPAASQAGIARAKTVLDDAIGKLGASLPLLRRQVNLGGQLVPVWALAAAGLMVVFLGVLVVGGLAIAKSDASVAASASGVVESKGADDLPDDVRELTARAMTGDRIALAQLEARPAASRTPAEWRALGRGYALSGNKRSSLDAYARALEVDPLIAKDKQLVSDIRHAATDATTADRVLTIAARHLGETGADLIYDLFKEIEKDKTMKSVADRAKEMLESPSVRVKASPALQVALDLNSAKGCAGARAVMPRAAQSADERSLPKLKRYNLRRGCGFFGTRDCWSCLRKGDDLKNALERAERTPAPRF